MLFVPVANSAEHHLMFHYHGEVCQNVFHTHKGDPYETVDLIAAATVFKDWWLEWMQARLPTQLTFDRIESFSLEAFNAPSSTVIEDLPAAGTNSSAIPLPNNVTFAVKWITGLRGRSYRGRTFSLGVTEDQRSGNSLQPTALTGYLIAYGALITALDVAGHPLAVVSKVTLGSPRVAGIATEIIGLSIDDTLDSQRRRLPGRGS